MHSEKAWLENLLLFCLLCTFLLLPAVLNGLPFLSADTASYLRVGAGIAGLFERALTSSEADVLLTAGRPVSPEEVRIGASYLAVRSPWYSFVAWVLTRAGGLWALALAQAAIAAALVLVAMRVVAPHAGGWMRLTAALAIGLGSTLGVYASSAMPDVFLGFGVLAAGLFLLWSERLPVRARWMVLLVVAIAAAAHPTHGPVLIGAVLVLAFASWLFPALLPSAAKRALVSVLLAALAGAAAIVIAREVGSRVLGEPLRYPPLLMARLVADGPGRVFLDRACATQPLALCAFRDRPLDDAQVILWDTDPTRGVFSVADADTRVRLIEEEMDIVLGALRTDPLGVLATALKNTFGLLFSIRLEGQLEPVMPPRALLAFEELLPGSVAAWERTAVVRGSWPFRLVEPWLVVTTVAALTFLGWWTVVGGRRACAVDERARHRALLLLVFAALIINAAICGIVSAPLPRYHMRALWLVPLCALLFALASVHPASAQRGSLLSAERS